MLHTIHSVKLRCHNDLHVDQVLVQPSSRGEASFWLTDLDSASRKNQPLPLIRARNRKYLAPEVRSLCVWVRDRDVFFAAAALAVLSCLDFQSYHSDVVHA